MHHPVGKQRIAYFAIRLVAKALLGSEHEALRWINGDSGKWIIPIDYRFG